MRYMRLIYRWFWLVLFCVSALPAFAVDRVDTEFGNNGFAVKDFGFGDDEVFALAVQDDGKLLVAGYSSNGAVMNMTVARYLPDGTLDISFNYDGLFLLSMGSGDTLARTVAVRADGTIVVAGSSFDTGPRLAVVVLTPDGYLDSGFGDNGRVVLPLSGEEIGTTDLQVADDGSVIVGVTVRGDDSSSYPLFVKLAADGEFESDFGDEGIVKYEQDDDFDMQSIALLDGEKFLAAGSVRKDGVMQAVLLRFKADGTPDLTFGDGGELLLGIEESGSVLNDLFVDSDGSILVAGSLKQRGVNRAFAARLNADGKVDSDFAEDGVFRSNLDYENAARAVTVQQDGTVVLAGSGSTGKDSDLIVWSISDNSRARMSDKDRLILDAEQHIVLRPLSVDDSLTGNDGAAGFEEGLQTTETQGVSSRKIVTDIGKGDDGGYAVAALSTGEILAAGFSDNGADKDFVLARYTTEYKSALSATGNSGGVVTAGFRIETIPVQDITRVSVVTGGNISGPQTVPCETTCKNECADEASSSCSSCLSECRAERPTVVLKGVCYSVSPEPVYSDEKEEIPVPEPRDSSQGTTSSEESKGFFTSDYFVRSGQTEDGSGAGRYISEVMDITPATSYYIRAYALLSDETVIYGNEWNFKTDDACFIATAAYGTILDRHVVLLRQFRDTFLMPTRLGRKFIGIYYHYSPDIADFVRESMVLRTIIRVALWPLTLFALFMLKTGPAVKIAGSVLTLLLTVFLLKGKEAVKRKN